MKLVLNPFAASALLAVSVLFAGPVGCTAETGDEAAEEEGSDDDLTASPTKSNVLGEVVAIEIDGKVVGSRAKVSSMLKAMKLGARDRKPELNPAQPRCALSHPIKFIGANNAEVASGGFMCGADQRTGVVRAFVRNATASYGVEADLGALFKQVDAPVQAGDMLYGITKVQITTPRNGDEVTTKNADQVKTLLSGVGQAVTPLAPNTPSPRCVPARFITFYRGAEVAAKISTMCSADTGVSPGRIFARDEALVGTVSLDMSKVSKVETVARD
jgi:hypothetical protein